MSPNSPQQHLIIVPMSAFGHVRPKLNLACNLVRLSDAVHITFLVLAYYLPRVLPEIARHNLTAEQESRIDCIGLGDPAKANHDFTENEAAEVVVAEGFADIYGKLLQGVPCGNPDKIYPKPTTCIIDIVSCWGPGVKKAVEDVVKPAHKIYLIGFCAVPGSYLGYWLDRFDPTSISTASRMLQKEICEHKMATGEDVVDGRARSFRAHMVEPELVEVLGMAVCYLHEIALQEAATRLPSIILDIGTMMLADFHLYDGYAQPWDINLEPEATHYFTDFKHKKGGMPFFPIGPQLPPCAWERRNEDLRQSREFSVETKPHAAIDFLDRMLKQYGKSSCMLISFGSLNFPVIQSQILALFETLFSLETPFPFVFCRDPRMMQLPDSLIKFIQSHSDTALMVEWSPQQTLLSHPALGWFLSHCGTNSASEAIIEGVGIIGWPIAIDQPIVASSLAVDHRVAFELCQVRMGFSINRPMARGGKVYGTDQAIRHEMREVFDKARGQEGKEMLERVSKLRLVLVESMQTGSARRAMEGLLTLGRE